MPYRAYYTPLHSKDLTSRYLVAASPPLEIIKLVEVRRIGDEFLVMSALLQFVKFLTKTAITAVVVA